MEKYCIGIQGPLWILELEKNKKNERTKEEEESEIVENIKV